MSKWSKSSVNMAVLEKFVTKHDFKIIWQEKLFENISKSGPFVHWFFFYGQKSE
jgi:hypothetical protein